MKLKKQIFKVVIIAIVLLLSGCWYQSDPQRLLEHYQKYHDYVSLEKLSHYLKPGMTKVQAEEMVGKPDYSPAPGIYYYGSNSGCLGLILIYHKEEDARDPSQVKVTKLDRVILGEIRE
jgi:hypothetical protein